MGKEEETSINEVEGWRIALLLLGFATVTLILEKTLHLLEKLVVNERGLSIALEHIKNELLFVGSISLLLSALQSPLSQICIPLAHGGVYDMKHRRQLLAGGYKDYCGPDKRSLWPVELLHDTHIFIFVVGCTHIVYGTLTVYLTLLRVRRWRIWEEEAIDQGRKYNDLIVMKIPAKWFYRNVGSNWLIHWMISIARQYYLSVNKSLYFNARLQFIEKLGLPYDFDFHGIVVCMLEDELMKTLHPEWHLWLIAVVWFAIPPPSYVSYCMYGLSLATTLMIGGKLVDILVQISIQVAVKYRESVVYGRMDSNPATQKDLTALGRSSLRSLAVRAPTLHRRFLDNARDPALAAAAGQTSTATRGSAATSGSPAVASELTVQQLSSREQALQMIRSWASTLLGGSFGGTAAGGAEGRAGTTTTSTTTTFAIRAATGAAEEASLVAGAPAPHAASGGGEEAGAASASTLTRVGTAGCCEGAATAPPGQGDDQPPPPPRQSVEIRGLARGSAPAAFRRQRISSSGNGRLGAAAPGSAGAATVRLEANGAVRKMSVIREGAVAPTDKPRGRTEGVVHRHHHHYNNRHRQPNQHHQPQCGPQQSGQDGARGSLGDRPPRACTSAGTSRDRNAGGGPEGVKAAPPGSIRRSVFEMFQRAQEHRVRTMSLHSTFHAPLPYDAPQQGPQSPPPLSPKVTGTAAAAAAAAVLSPAADADAVTATSGTPAADIAPAAAAASGPAVLPLEEPQPPGASVTTAHGGSSAASSQPANGSGALVGPKVLGSATANGEDGGLVNGDNSLATAVAAPACGAEEGAGLGGAPSRSGSLSACGSYSGSSGSSGRAAGASRRGSAGARAASRLFRVTKTASGRRKVPLLLLPCYCGKYTLGSHEYVRELLLQNHEKGIHLADAKDFFWLGRPRFLIGLFTLAYFQNSLSIAICIFSLAGEFYNNLAAWKNVGTWGIVLQLCLDLLLLPMVALCILPLYALISPLGSHCNRELLERAIQEGTDARRMHGALDLDFSLPPAVKTKTKGSAILARIKAAFGLRHTPERGLRSVPSLQQRPGRGPESEPVLGPPGSRVPSGRARSSIAFSQLGCPSDARFRASRNISFAAAGLQRADQLSDRFQYSQRQSHFYQQQFSCVAAGAGASPRSPGTPGGGAARRLTIAVSGTRRGGDGGGGGGGTQRRCQSPSWVAMSVRGAEEHPATGRQASAPPVGYSGLGAGRSGIGGIYRRAVASFVGRGGQGQRSAHVSPAASPSGGGRNVAGRLGPGGGEGKGKGAADDCLV